MEEMIALLKEAPESQLDPTMVGLVRRWDDPPRAIQVLEVLDMSVHGALASDMVMYVINLVYQDAIKREGTTHEQLVAQATWRGAE